MRKVITILTAFALLLVGSQLMDINAQETNTKEVNISYYYDSDNIVDHPTMVSEYGTKISYVPSPQSGYRFSHWVLNGTVRKDLPEDHEFVVRNVVDLVAMFVPEDEHVVTFMDTNGALLDVQYVSPGSDTLFQGQYPDKPFMQLAQDPWGGEDLSNIQKDKLLIVNYVRDTNEEYTLVKDVSLFGGSEESVNYGFNDVATVEADPDYLDNFSYWEDVDTGTILSYDPVYAFTMLEDKNIKAEYGESTDDEPLITISENLQLRSGKVSHLAQFYLPDDYEMIEYGMISTPHVFDNITLETEGVDIFQGDKYHGPTNEFLMSLDETTVTNPRAYLVYKDDAGTMNTVYSDVKHEVVAEREYEDLTTETMIYMWIQDPSDDTYIMDWSAFENDEHILDSNQEGWVRSTDDTIEPLNIIEIDGIKYSIDEYIDTDKEASS